MIPDCCSDCAFDGDILGRPVWRLDDPRQAAMAVAAARSDGVGLLTCRGDEAHASVLGDAGFRMVETLISFRQALSGSDQTLPTGVRCATAADADAVAGIAAGAFHSDRWHADPEIPDAAADRMKAQWARNDVLGRAAVVFLALQQDGEIAGFNAILTRDDVAIIDLIAVKPDCRGQGHARRLIAAAQSLPQKTLQVGTQASNAASIQLYQSTGFVEFQRQITWHWTP